MRTDSIIPTAKEFQVAAILVLADLAVAAPVHIFSSDKNPGDAVVDGIAFWMLATALVGPFIYRFGRGRIAQRVGREEKAKFSKNELR